jgi:hypothetical protein
MRRRGIGRALRVTAILLAFAAVVTVGGLWHHHTNPLAAETCPICHAMHLPLSPVPASAQLPALVRLGRAVSPPAPLLALARTSSPQFSRAPPA